jgi:hypothetical protein
MALPCPAREQIQSYDVPKEQPALLAAQSPMAAGAPNIPISSASIHWTLPDGWLQKPADGIRLGSFTVKGTNGALAEVAITSFPGTVGTELDNVNRWRGELALAPVGAGDIASEPVTVDSAPGKLYELDGASARTVVAVIPHNGNTCFVKLRGDAITVAGAKPAFMNFLKSIQFGGDGAQAAPTAPTGAMPPISDPHAGLGLPPARKSQAAVPTPEAQPASPEWKVPAQWVEGPPRSIIFKNFSVSGDAGAKAEITISFFPGDAGGVLNNVNLWRSQLGLGPIEAAQMEHTTETLTTADSKATLVDFVGASTGKPARMVGAIVPQGGKTWFYKMMGDAKVVGGQKDAFVQFVKTVHYP